MTKNYRINPKNQNISIQTLIDRIDKGFELQKIGLDSMTEELILAYNDSIILDPDYQREYRASKIDESSLIESVLVGIPIPPVFLANDKYNQVQVLNVVDGQHRLRAFYRYVKGLFNLKSLSLLEQLENKYFSDLTIDDKTSILSYELSSVAFKDFPGKEFELEIFNRYNKGTKPLSKQEIRHAVYNSDFNLYVNKFAKSLAQNSKSPLAKAYSFTQDRFLKKRLQENIFVIISILESGIISGNEKSSNYAEEFMKKKSIEQQQNIDNFNILFKPLTSRFEEFNKLILLLTENVDYPFSKELYGIESRNYKFQISIAMILSGIIYEIYKNYDSIDKLLLITNIPKFISFLKKELSSSYLEDPEYRASTTSPSKIIELIDNCNINDFYSEIE